MTPPIAPVAATVTRMPPAPAAHDTIHHADNMDVLPELPDESFQLVYIDPPFNTGETQSRRTLAMAPDEDGDRTGFKGKRYSTRLLAESRYRDTFEDYLAFLEPRLTEARRAARAERHALLPHRLPRGALLQAAARRAVRPRAVPQRADLGLRLRRALETPLAREARHDPRLREGRGRILLRLSEEVDREPYMAPGLVTPEKAARGKLPTDVWWHTIVPTNGREKTGYPTQKPEGIVRRMVQASTRPGDWCLDFFAGSGTLGAVAAQLGRRYVLIDESADAVAVMRRRLPAAALAPALPA